MGGQAPWMEEEHRVTHLGLLGYRQQHTYKTTMLIRCLRYSATQGLSHPNPLAELTGHGKQGPRAFLEEELESRRERAEVGTK